MAIQSSQKDSLPVSSRPQAKEEDALTELTLRPKRLEEYIGQKTIKQHLKIIIASAKKRNAPLEHVLLYGPPGLGKTTLSMIIASEMSSHLRQASGPAIEKPADLVSILSSLQEGDVLFIDEIHRLRPQLEEILYGAMEDFQIDIMIGSGNGATTIQMPLPKFTLVGATTKLSKLSAPLRDRFGSVIKLDYYSSEELSQIVNRSFQVFGLESPTQTIIENIAKRSRGTPRIANRYVKTLRDYIISGESLQTAEEIEGIFEQLGISPEGLDPLDQKYLQCLEFSFGGGPVGLSALAAMVGEEPNTLEEVVEPFLLQLGYIDRSTQGRSLSQGYYKRSGKI